MKIQSRLSEGGLHIVRKEIADDYNQKSILSEETKSVGGKYLEKIRNFSMSTSGCILVDTQFFLTELKTHIFTITGNSVIMEFIYNTENETTTEIRLPTGKVIPANRHNTWYAPHRCVVTEIPAFQQRNYFAIIMSPGFYFKIIDSGAELYEEFSENVRHNKACRLSAANLPFSAAINCILHEIRSCQKKGLLKRMYFENKIRELLLLQKEMLLNESTSFQIAENSIDYHKIHNARSILNTDYIIGPSLSELSRQISLNEFKLKRGFKVCFGTTVRSYIIKLRMERAKELLMKKPSSVSEVAYECGYKDVSHFSAAFKKFYGFSPKKFKVCEKLAFSWYSGLFMYSFLF